MYVFITNNNKKGNNLMHTNSKNEQMLTNLCKRLFPLKEIIEWRQRLVLYRYIVGI